MYDFEIGALTDKGNIKEVNQDNILVKIGEYNGQEFGLFLVYVGLGGLTNGEVASMIAINEFKRWWEEEIRGLVKSGNDSKILNSISSVIRLANRHIKKFSTSINEKAGTTISALFIIGNKYYVIHVGDSRIYKITNRTTQLTEDHSLVAMKVKRGELTRQEAKISKQKNILLQCVGVKDTIDIFTSFGEIDGGEMFLLCSDGFYNKTNEGEIFINLKKWDRDREVSLQQLTESMVDLIKERKERDNISAIVVNLKIRRKEKKSFLDKLFG